jgi:hypothetical protein
MSGSKFKIDHHFPDVSIKRRALELSFALVNQQNFKMLTKELIAFLQVKRKLTKYLKLNFTYKCGCSLSRLLSQSLKRNAPQACLLQQIAMHPDRANVVT